MINKPYGVSNTRFGPSIVWLRNISMTLLAYAMSGFDIPALHNYFLKYYIWWHRALVFDQQMNGSIAHYTKECNNQCNSTWKPIRKIINAVHLNTCTSKRGNLKGILVTTLMIC